MDHTVLRVFPIGIPVPIEILIETKVGKVVLLTRSVFSEEEWCCSQDRTSAFFNSIQRAVATHVVCTVTPRPLRRSASSWRRNSFGARTVLGGLPLLPHGPVSVCFSLKGSNCACEEHH